MSFREKSAWAMGALMLATGLYYLNLVLALPAATPATAQLGALVPYVMAVVVGSIVIQIALAIFAPRDAQKQADERERQVIDRAAHWSSYILATGVVCGVIHYVAYGQGNYLLHIAVGSLIAAQFAEYVFQVALFRRGL